MPTHSRYFFVIPFAHGLQRAAFCGDYAVDRAVDLPGLDVFIHRIIVVQYLAFHPRIGEVALQRRSQSYAIVRSMVKSEIKLESKVRILFLGDQVPAALLGTFENPILWHISGADAAEKHPACQRFPVKKLCIPAVRAPRPQACRRPKPAASLRRPTSRHDRSARRARRRPSGACARRAR